MVPLLHYTEDALFLHQALLFWWTYSGRFPDYKSTTSRHHSFPLAWLMRRQADAQRSSAHRLALPHIFGPTPYQIAILDPWGGR